MVANILQILGAAVVTAGIAMLSLPIAAIFAGISLVVFGVALERR